MKLDASWSKHLLESFRSDDTELYEIALESSLVDLDCRVVGGDNGAPMSIGDQGLYSGNQFEAQVDVLQKVEREHISRAGVFISDFEWTIIDGNLRRLGQFSTPRFANVYPGDTWACLAVADNAFLVANALVERGVDPLLENSTGGDLFDIVKRQYAVVTTRLRDLRVEKEEAAKQLVLPSAAQAMEKQERAVVDTLNNLHTFCTSLKDKYQQRLRTIETDQVDIRRADRSGVLVDPWKRWNASLHAKVAARIHECDDLRGYITERLQMTQRKNSEAAKKGDFTRAILQQAEDMRQQQLVIGMDEDGDGEGPGEDDYFPDESGLMGSLEGLDGSESRGSRGSSSAGPSFLPLLQPLKPSRVKAPGPPSVRSTSTSSEGEPPTLSAMSSTFSQSRLSSTASTPKMNKKLSWGESVLESNMQVSAGSVSGSGSLGGKEGGLAPVLGILSKSDDSIVMYK